MVSFVLMFFFCIKNNSGKVLEPLISRKKEGWRASVLCFEGLCALKNEAFLSCL